MNYPRYLKAVLYRLEHYSSDPARDVARQADVERLTLPLVRAVSCAPRAA